MDSPIWLLSYTPWNTFTCVSGGNGAAKNLANFGMQIWLWSPPPQTFYKHFKLRFGKPYDSFWRSSDCSNVTPGTTSHFGTSRDPALECRVCSTGFSMEGASKNRHRHRCTAVLNPCNLPHGHVYDSFSSLWSDGFCVFLEGPSVSKKCPLKRLVRQAPCTVNPK